MKKKIIFTAGGTGGHIFPAINLMKHVFEKEYEVLLVTDFRGNKFIKNYKGIKSYVLKAGTPTNKNILKKFISFFVIFYSFIQSIIIIKKEKPNLIFGFGGYVSFPISFVSIFFKIPLIIYENNMVFGRTNKLLSKFSKKILIAKKISKNFPNKYISKTFEVGSILKKDIINHSYNKNNLNKSDFNILVLGGSQGAEIFGKIVPNTIKMLKDAGFKVNINQQCLQYQKEQIQNFYNKNNIKSHVFEFDSNILKLILSCDLAITRCGASTTSELAYTITPFIAVPLPFSIDDHQYLNAKYYEDKGCCWILEQNRFNSENLFNLIMDTLKNKNKLEMAREKLKKIYNKDVYSDIENKIKETI